jgi:hypothetical protein
MSFSGTTSGGHRFKDIIENRSNTAFTVIKKFGRGSIGTTPAIISTTGTYPTPQAASGTKLRIKAGGDANDTAAGSGARSVRIEGISATDGSYVYEELATAGASASALSTNTYMRLFRAYVYEAGSYAQLATPSQAADITIEDAAGSTDWCTIDDTTISTAQSEIGCFTVPLGYEAYVSQVGFTSNANKVVNIMQTQRQSILDSAAPYQARRAFNRLVSNQNQLLISDPMYYGPFPELTDLECIGWVDATTAVLSIYFTVLLVVPGG